MEEQIADPHEITAVARGAGIVLAGAVTGNALRYAYQLIVARHVGPQVFGALLLGTAVLQVMMLVSDLGLSQSVVRFVAIFRGAEDQPRVKGIILLASRAVLVSGPLLGALLFIFSAMVARRVFHNADLTLILRVMAVLLPIITLTFILAYSFQGLQVIKYKIYVLEFVEPAFRVALVATFLAAGAGLKGVLFGYGLASLFALAAAVVFMSKAFPAVFRREFKPVFERRRLFSFAWPLLPAFLMGYLIVWNDAFFLGLLKTSREVGIYGAAQRTALIPTFILGAFIVNFGPIIADLLSRGRKEDLSRHYRTVVHWIFSLTLPPAALLVLYARPVLRIFGDAFGDGAGALIILSCGWIVHALLGLGGTFITMSGRSKVHLLNTLFLAALNVSLHLLLIPRYGILGAAAATAGSVVIFDLLTLVEVRIILGLTPFRPELLKPLAACGLGLAGHAALKRILGSGTADVFSAAAGSLAFLVIFAAATFGLGIRSEDKLILGKVLMKLRSLGPGGRE